MSATVGGWCLAIGSLVALSAVLLKRHAQKQHSWPKVPGTIENSKVVFDGEYFDPSVEYAYNYRDRVFRGRKFCSLLVAVNWRGPAWRWVDRYPAGSMVTVFVDPNNACNAVLEPGGDRKFLPVVLTIAGSLIAFGAWCLIAAWRA